MTPVRGTNRKPGMVGCSIDYNCRGFRTKCQRFRRRSRFESVRWLGSLAEIVRNRGASAVDCPAERCASINLVADVQPRAALNEQSHCVGMAVQCRLMEGSRMGMMS